MKIPFLTRRGQRKQDDALHEPRQGLFHQDFHMFSNDQNIETIAQLVESVKHYASLQGENVKLEVVEKTVRVLTVVAMTAILSLILMLILIYLSFAFKAHWQPRQHRCRTPRRFPLGMEALPQIQEVSYEATTVPNTVQNIKMQAQPC